MYHIATVVQVPPIVHIHTCMCRTGVEMVDTNAGDSRQEYQLMNFYSGQGEANTTDDSTKADIKTGFRYKVM